MRTSSLVLPLVLGLATLARADQPPPRPAIPPGGKVPTTPVPCLPEADERRLAAVDGEPVVCWGPSCMRLAERDPATMIAPPPEPKDWTSPRAEVIDKRGAPMVCLATDCKPVGPKLAAAIAEERKAAKDEDRPVQLGATTDRKAVVVGRSAWSLAGDKPLTFKVPSSYGKDEDPPEAWAPEVAGNVLVVTWSNCAGPCTVGQIVDSSGKNRGASFAGGGPIVQLDATRFVVMSEYADLTVFDMKGKRLGDLPVGGEPNAAALVVLDESTLAVLREGGDGWRVTVVSVAESGQPRVGWEKFLPRCAR